MSNKDFSKLDNEASVDLNNIRSTKKSSHASQLGKRRSEEATIDIAVRVGVVWGVVCGSIGCLSFFRLEIVSCH